jgi:GNAT superfamily N-acetyltransferase
MITFANESFEKTLPEFEPLLHTHYEELALNQDKVPLSPQYSVYFDRERMGQLLFITAREDGTIIGYFIGFISPGLHYSTCLTCQMDIFYIKKEYRNGRAGIKLFQFIEKELKRRGVQRWFVGSKLHADASSLFKYLKFSPVETFYTKWIGD